MNEWENKGFEAVGKFSYFNFIQQKSLTSVSGEMNAYWYSIQWGSNPG
ncbi:hypothetical protein J6TS1_46250 [Siminovitchia terrae]|uniref:Uncharacterized protein n=1 Tax=Siminovitchia terrae TaxID=1914933 RepID=A0ABQ4L3A8_SIMTE|nr:hypothetical protein [Siminovitchia terrae]GIN94047.1 hypothetical protein J22TS1_50980 [Siminovitchia terrae]GIN98755.1 hypothetical protein J6TS1_46250 [Siminovitchia terrae]